MFDVAKTSTLKGLLDGENDKSPKGSIDAPILDLLNYVNGLEHYFTLSSCSGRISLYQDQGRAKGVNWILVEHGLMLPSTLKKAVHASLEAGHDLVLKCEPMILHVRCRTRKDAMILYQVAMDAGFRESGIGGSEDKVMVAVRTTSNLMEVPLTQGNRLMVDDATLEFYVTQANKKLLAAFARNDVFLNRLKMRFSWPYLIVGRSSPPKKDSNAVLEVDVSHASSVKLVQEELHVVVGGRRAMTALSDEEFVRVYVSGARERRWTLTGSQVVQARWGHTLTCLESSSTRTVLLLFGGRDATRIFSDSFLLHLCHDICSYSWSALPHLELATPRFFHAAVLIPNHATHNEIIVITGGLRDLSGSAAHDDVQAWAVQREGAGLEGEALMLSPVTCELKYKDNEKIKSTEGIRLLATFRRFGHSITVIGAKSILVTGGNSFEPGEGSIPHVVVDYSAGSAAQIVMEPRRARFVQGYPGKDACSSCRSHHSVEVQRKGSAGLASTIIFSGGKVPCLGIGQHECSSCTICVNTSEKKIQAQMTVMDSKMRLDKQQDKSESGSLVNPDVVESHQVLLVQKPRVKSTKTFLESRGMLNKSFKIVMASGNHTDVKVVPLLHGDVVEEQVTPFIPNLSTFRSQMQALVEGVSVHQLCCAPQLYIAPAK